MKIPFDNNSGEIYTLEIAVSEIESGDGVVLTLNRKACESFAALFLAMASAESCEHVHLGYNESQPQGLGLRIIVSE